MASKVTRKITEALSDLLGAYSELIEGLQADLGLSEETQENEELTEGLESSVVNEVRAALESVMDQDDFVADEIASLISSLTEALEEIDPTIFEAGDDDEEESVEEDEDEYVVDDEEDDYDEYDDEDDYGEDDSYDDIDDLDD